MFLWSKVYLETDKSLEDVEKLLKENTKEMPNFILFWEKEPKFLFYGKVEQNGFLLKQTDRRRGASYKGIVVDKNNKSIIVFWRKWRMIFIIFYCFLFYTLFKNCFFNFKNDFDVTSMGFNFIFLVGLIILIMVDHCDEEDLKIKLQNLLSAHELKM